MLLVTLLLGTVPNRAIASATWTETTDTNFNDGVYNLTRTSGTGTAAQLTLSPFGNAADGSVTITTNKNINTDTISGGRSYADGVNYAISSIGTNYVDCTATVNGIVSGDEVMLISQQGDGTNYGNVGNYEFLRVSSVSEVRINFTSNILKIYGATTSNSVLTGQKVTVQRVPNWGAFTIIGATLTCSAWDGTKGGMVVFRATGTVTINSGAGIDVTTKGFRGGTPASDGTGTGFTGAEDAHNPSINSGGSDGGNAGDSVGGDGGTATGAGGTAGNGGEDPSAGIQAGTGNRGGGGGGAGGGTHHAGSGGGGCYNSGSNYSNVIKLTMGGGSAVGGGGGAGSGHGTGSSYSNGGKKNGYGGAGTTNASGDTGGNGGRGCVGNRGGGLIIIYASTFSGSGGINSQGDKGGSGGGGGAAGHCGGGGGGGGGANGAAGGSIIIRYNNSTWSGSSSISGGTGGGGGGGGAGTDQDMQSRNGGGGGGAGSGGGGGGGGEAGGYGQAGHGGQAGLNGLKGYGASSENGGVAPGGGGTMYGNQVGGSANSGGSGSPNGNNASGMNGGIGGSGTGAGGGGGGGAQGATGASGYSCIVSTGFCYCYSGNYRANVLNSGADGTKVHQVDWNPTSQAAGTDVDVFARASNSLFAASDGTPSWTSVSNGGDPAVVGRYIQWMSTFTTTSSTTTPKIEDITLTYTSPPPQATGVSGTVLGVSSITWNWTDNSSGQYQEDGFKVYCATSTELRNTAATDAVTWTETGLKANTTYQRYIQSYNTAGSSNSATVTKVTLCEVPVSMTIASPSYTQLELNWDANGNPDGTKYIAHCSPDGFAAVYSSTVTATMATFNSLTRNTEYEVRVYAVNHEGVCTGYLGQYSRKTQPGTWQEKTTTRTGKNSYGFEGDGIWTWKVPADGGSQVTITAYVQYNSDYGGAAKPKFTLSNMGVNSSDQMTGGAGVWEKLTVSGTPSGKGVLFLKVEGFSTAVDAQYFVDDIQISQP